MKNILENLTKLKEIAEKNNDTESLELINETIEKTDVAVESLDNVSFLDMARKANIRG